jgi:hypothetical protein
MPNTQQTSPLDPQNLAKNVTALVSTALMSQARALVVDRQQDAAAYIDDPVLAVRTRDSQEELARDVDYYLNRVLPDVIGRLSDGNSAATLVSALGATAGTATGQQAPDELLSATLAQFGQYQSAAADLADTLTSTATRAAMRGTDLETALQQVIDGLQGADGEIQQTKDAITTTREAISQDLAGIVKAADEIGSGVKTWLLDKVKIVTGILSSFGGSDEEEADEPKAKAKPKPKTKDTSADDGEDGEDGGEDDGQAPVTPAKPKKKFDVSGLDVDVDTSGDDGTGGTSKGATDLGDAAAAFRTHNDELAGLYQLLATQRAELAVAAAISDQAAGFAASLRTAASAAGALAASWQSVLDAADPLGEETDPKVLSAALTTAVSGASAHWAGLASELSYARSALAGKSGLIPDVGPLPDVDDE